MFLILSRLHSCYLEGEIILKQKEKQLPPKKIYLNSTLEIKCSILQSQSIYIFHTIIWCTHDWVSCAPLRAVIMWLLLRTFFLPEVHPLPQWLTHNATIRVTGGYTYWTRSLNSLRGKYQQFEGGDKNL